MNLNLVFRVERCSFFGFIIICGFSEMLVGWVFGFKVSEWKVLELKDMFFNLVI